MPTKIIRQFNDDENISSLNGNKIENKTIFNLKINILSGFNGGFFANIIKSSPNNQCPHDNKYNRIITVIKF